MPCMRGAQAPGQKPMAGRRPPDGWTNMTDTTPPSRPGFSEALRVWAKIGLLSFGGPAGQIAMMHRVLVDEKKWLSEPRSAEHTSELQSLMRISYAVFCLP